MTSYVNSRIQLDKASFFLKTGLHPLLLSKIEEINVHSTKNTCITTSMVQYFITLLSCSPY